MDQTTKIVFRALQNVGGPEAVGSPEDDLRLYGVDSLILALWIVELESEFKVRVPLEVIGPEHFQNLTLVSELMKNLVGLEGSHSLGGA